MVELLWSQIDLSERAKRILIYKYGQPKRVEKQTGNLFWLDRDIMVKLDTGLKETRLYYTHTKLTELFEKEKAG